MRRGTLRSRVQLVDLVGEVLLHDAAAKLERRRQLALLLREIARENREALDLLDAHAVAVDLVDERLHELLRIALGSVDLGGIERDERRHVRAPVSDDERLRDEPRGLERVLEILRRDVLAAGRDDQVLLAIGDLEEAVLVELADVAGAEPAVLRERGRRRLGL